MPMKLRVLLVAAGWLVIVACPAAAQTAPRAHYTRNGFDPHLLSTRVPRAERMKLFAHVIALANQGQVRAQDLAGTLYWQGGRTKGSPVDRNLVQARKLLANAAIHGDVLAMAKLAELELAEGRTLQAMVWAQMYARYLDPMAMERSRRGHQAAYAASLIKRILKAGGKIDDATSRDVAALVNRFDAGIRDGIHTFASLDRRGTTFLTVQPMPPGLDPGPLLNRNGVAEYMIEFDPSGAPQRIWLLAAYPDPDMGAMLRVYLDHVHANTAARGSGMRYLQVAITHNAYKFQSLRPTH